MKQGQRSVVVAAVCGVLLSVGCGGHEEGQPMTASEARSVILIAVDGLRADRLGSFGGSVQTPSFDALAAESIRFEWSFAQAPDPAVSFASLLTGLYPTTNGVIEPGDRLPDAAVTMAEAASSSGFETAAFVEGAEGADDLGLGQGFGVYSTSPEPAAEARRWIGEHSTDHFLVVLRGWSVGLDLGAVAATEGIEAPEGFAERLQQVLASVRSDRPLPFDEADLDFVRQLYGLRVRAADQALGELMAELDNLGVTDSVVLVVTGTDGLDLGQHPPTGALSLHATVTRVPLFVRLPAAGSAQVVDKIVELVDLAPTLLDLAGVEVPSGCQGASLLPLIAGGGRPPYIAFSESPWLGRQRAVALGGLRLVTSLDSGETALYDLAADPNELMDVASDHPDKVEVLARHLEAWGKMVSVASLDPDLRTEGELDDETLEQLKSLGYIQ